MNGTGAWVGTQGAQLVILYIYYGGIMNLIV